MSDAPAVHPAIVQAAWSIVGAVPGCVLAHVSHAGLTPANVAGTPAPAPTGRLKVGVTGWSPSLHQVEMEWRIGPLAHDAQPGSAAQVAACAAHLEDLLGVHVSTMRRRAADALALGLATPTPFAAIGTADLAHLLVDRSLLALLIEGCGLTGRPPAHAIERHLVPALRRLHQHAVDLDVHDPLRDDRCSVTEIRASSRDARALIGARRRLPPDAHPDAPPDAPRGRVADLPWRRVLAFAVELMPQGGGMPWGPLPPDDGAGPAGPYSDPVRAPADLAGDVLTIRGHSVPDTAATALEGRPLGDLARLHPMLDRRSIRRVDVMDGALGVTLAPDLARIGDILTLGMHEALEHLATANPAP